MDEQNILFIAALVLFSGLLLLLTVRAVNVTRYFCRRTFFLVGKLREPGNDESFAYWRKELRCHYLTLIPFVTKRNVGSIYQLFFYKARYAKPRERFDGLNHLMAPSLLTICACTFCLCGMSWAWFSASTSSDISPIQFAKYEVTVTQNDQPLQLTNGVYQIEATSNAEYKITVKGTAKNVYCVINLNSTVYYTPTIPGGSFFTFKINGMHNGKLTVVWGVHNGDTITKEINASSSTSS